jgi:hypothetical protein
VLFRKGDMRYQFSWPSSPSLITNFFLSEAQQPKRGLGRLTVEVPVSHTIRHTYTRTHTRTPCRTPLKEWSSRRRGRCLHN